MTFLTFTIGKFESSEFHDCLTETKILHSYFEITNSESKSTSQMNKSE